MLGGKVDSPIFESIVDIFEAALNFNAEELISATSAHSMSIFFQRNTHLLTYFRSRTTFTQLYFHSI